MEATSSGPIPIPSADGANRVAALDGDALRAAFDGGARYTVGIEDEVMLVDPDTLELVPNGPRILERMRGDDRFKLELPASQLEIVTPPSSCAAALAAPLFEARVAIAQAADGVARPVSVPVHPFSSGLGELNTHERYQHTISEYAEVARRQLVCALQVHVAVGDADRALAIYNVIRSYLPLLAALAASGPFYEGRDTGLASVRPKLSELLPRQGVPPAIESWDQYAEMLAWGSASRSFSSARTWWWELRPHSSYGTLEFRVPDAQSTVADAVAVAALVQALVVWLGDRYDAGRRDHIAATWRIEENRWSACRYGVSGTMADLQGGERRPTGECLHELLDAVSPIGRRLGSLRELEHARELVATNGAIAQRQVAQNGGARAATRWLAERFVDVPPG